MKKIVLPAVPATLKTLASKAFDGIKLPKPENAIEYQDGPMSFVTCGFPDVLDSSLRAMIFKPVEGLEYLCHARLSFRPSSSSERIVSYELDYQALSSILEGTGIKVINTAGSVYLSDFFHSMDTEFLNVFRQSEAQISLDN